MTLRSLSLLMTVLFLPAALWAGSVELRNGKTVITVVAAVVADPSLTDAASRADVAALRRFQEVFPEIFKARYRDRYKADPQKYGRFNWDDVEIKVTRFSALKVEGVETDLLAIAGGMAPDVLYLNFRKSDNYIRSSFLYPLDRPEDGYLSAMTQEEIDFRIHPKLWPVIRRKGPKGAEHVWAMPYGGAVGRVLLFRKDLFDEKKIAFPDENWTWNDLLCAVRELHDARRGIYGLAMGTGKSESHNWTSFVWSAGGEIMEYDAAGDSWRCVFDSDAAVTALDFYTRLTAEKWTDRGGRLRRGYVYQDPDYLRKWTRGEIGIILDYVDEKLLSTTNPDLVGMAPLPKGPTGLRGAELNSRMMALFAGIESPVVRDAAWEYMRFYDCEEAQRLKTRVMVEGGLGAFINPKYLRQFGYPEIERLSPPGWMKTFEIAMDTGRPEPYGKNSTYAYELMTIPLQQANQLAMSDALPLEPAERRNVLAGLLRAANARANEEMIGIVAPGERLKRRVLAAVVLVAIFGLFAWVFYSISKVFAAAGAAGAVGMRASFMRRVWPFVLLLPALASILVWQYIPLSRGSLMAFQDYQLLGKTQWVGLDHFGDLLVNSFWWQSLWNSIRYSFLVIALTFLPPILLAILLQEVPRGKILFRTIYYLPAVIAGLVVMLLWKQFFDPSDSGILNAIMMRIPAGVFVLLGVVLFAVAAVFARRMWWHEMRWPSLLAWMAGVLLLLTAGSTAWPILFPGGESLMPALRQLPGRLLLSPHEPYRWLQDERTAMISCVIPMIWAGIGPGCLIYLAALKGIPDDYYEAADLDGANFVDKVMFIIFPILKPLVIIQFVGTFIGSFYGAGGNILAMTGGGANTEVTDLHIWYKAFTFLNFGAATAMAWMLAFLLIGFTVYQLRMLSRVEFRTTGAGGKN